MGLGSEVRPHSHPRAQLLWATTGVLRATSGQNVWIVPPSHAVWIPADVPHAVTCETEVQTRNLYIDASLSLRPQDAACTVIALTPLLRALILRLGECDMENPFPAPVLRLAGVIADELGRLPAAPLSLPGGHDPRLVALTRHLGANPADPRPFPDLARMVGASPRTLERLFHAETGLTFRQWRSRLKLLAAVEALTMGKSSTEIAWSLGYASPSAFIAAFHAQFGAPPQRFLQGAA